MYATSSGDSVASIDVPDDGFIVGAQLFCAGRSPSAANASIVAELSFGSTNQLTTNDARNVIISNHWHAGDVQVAEVANMAVTNNLVYPDGLTVFAGERIHLHTAVVALTMSEVVALLVFQFRKFSARRR